MYKQQKIIPIVIVAPKSEAIVEIARWISEESDMDFLWLFDSSEDILERMKQLRPEVALVHTAISDEWDTLLKNITELHGKEPLVTDYDLNDPSQQKEYRRQIYIWHYNKIKTGTLVDKDDSDYENQVNDVMKRAILSGSNFVLELPSTRDRIYVSIHNIAYTMLTIRE